jgi:RNA polymerase sigma factor (TIGR02999 family)
VNDQRSERALAAAQPEVEQPAAEFLPALYEELRHIARRRLRGRQRGRTLTTTALVHEAFLKLAGNGQVEWRDRPRVMAVAAVAMRQILVDHARAQRALKRGGDIRRVSLDDARLPADDEAGSLLELHDALTRLAGIEPRMARVVELRFFGGLTEAETAELLGITDRSVRRDWVKAKGWLYAQLAG